MGHGFIGKIPLDMGVSNGKIEIEEGDGTITGDLRALGYIKNEGRSTVEGDVITNGKIHDKRGLTVTGRKIERATLHSISLPTLSFSAGGPKVRVRERRVQGLAPGSYGDVKVEERATLELSGGEYYTALAPQTVTVIG